MDALPPGHSFETMTAAEVATITDWAAGEEWNPGLHDIGIAHAVDPEAFIALRREGEMVGGGSIFRYPDDGGGGSFGFMGLFIMRADLRGQGLGTVLWHHRLARLRARLAPGATIGMDGVFAMEPFYAKGGFRLAYRDLRFDGIAISDVEHADLADLTELADVAFEALDAYDARHVPVPRTEMLRRWVQQPGAHTAAAVDDGRLTGFAVLRPCRRGFRFGPVLADDGRTADRLLRGLMARVAGQPVQLDVPEPNEAGLALAQTYGFTESFGCARMYHGPAPDLPVDRIFGVTSFEFG